MKSILLQATYIMRHPSWWVGVALSFAAMMQGMLSDGLIHGMNLAYQIVTSMNAGVFIPLAPMAAILSVSKNMENAMRNTCCYTHLLRTGRQHFIVNMIVSAGIAGGTALAFGWLLSALIAITLGSAPLVGDNMLGLEQTSMGILLTNANQAWLYYFLRLLFVFLYGFFCVCCAAPIAAWRQDSAMLCLIPFVMLRVAQFFLYKSVSAFFSPTRILLGFVEENINLLGAILMDIAGLVLLSSILVECAATVFKRRLQLDQTENKSLPYFIIVAVSYNS